ncbi:MAG: YicC/YloC family endoribonuclease [Phycisphaerales bacterium]
MIRSMTGFGEAEREVDGVHYTVEVRSLNNRFFKASVRLPEELQGLEADIDSVLRRRLTRGSITLTVRCSDTTATAAYQINIEALQSYVDRLGELPHDAGHPPRVDIGSLLSLPGVLQPPADLEQRVERIRPIIHNLVDEACEALLAMRGREGDLVREDLHRHREVIEAKLDSIAGRAPAVVEEYHQRLRTRIESMLADAGVRLTESDLIKEVAVYAERSDISEEVARLSGHMTQFREMIDRDAAESIGRTLDFLAQEMLREANTIASKSNDALISREIVEIKGAIDRIKEQAQNVE